MKNLNPKQQKEINGGCGYSRVNLIVDVNEESISQIINHMQANHTSTLGDFADAIQSFGLSKVQILGFAAEQWCPQALNECWYCIW